MTAHSGPARLTRAALCGLALLLGACVSAPATVAGVQPVLASAPDESAARKRARLRLELAAAYLQQGQEAVALEELDHALAADPGYAPAWNLRGLVQLRLALWSEAEKSLARALALDPQDADVAHNVGWAVCQQPRGPARLAESQALFRRALGHPGYAQPGKTWLALGLCQQAAGQLENAEASLRQAVLLEPGNARAGLSLAQLQFALGRWQDASDRLSLLHAGGQASAESVWLAIKAARKLDNPHLVLQLARQLHHEFGRSPQAAAYDKGLFDE